MACGCIRLSTEFIASALSELGPSFHAATATAVLNKRTGAQWASLALASVDDASGYFHDNGFLKVTLPGAPPPDQPGWRLRIHIWDSLWQLRATQLPHTHSFSFVSKVLVGSFRQRLYSITKGDDSRECLELEYDPGAVDDNEYQLKRKGKVDLTLTEERILNPGEVYAVTASECHAIDAISGNLSATLVASYKPPDFEVSRIFAKDTQNLSSLARERSPISPELVVRALNQIKGTI